MRAIAAVFIVSVALCAFGCGEGSEGSTGQSSAQLERPHDAAKEAPLKMIGGRQVFVKGRSACRSAGVRTGPGRGELLYEAHCAGTIEGGDLEFVLLRRPYPRSAREAPILQASRGFSVRGSGKVVGPAGCRVNRGELRCGASLRGRAVLVGRFWVDPDSRCEFGVSVVSITAPACSAPNCDGVLRVAEIHSGRPKGCSGKG